MSRTIVGLAGDVDRFGTLNLRGMPGVRDVVPISAPSRFPGLLDKYGGRIEQMGRTPQWYDDNYSVAVRVTPTAPGRFPAYRCAEDSDMCRFLSARTSADCRTERCLFVSSGSSGLFAIA